MAGVLHGAFAPQNGESRVLALPAELDARPMQERAAVDYRSRVENRFHGCGDDGHTVIRLAATSYLAQHRDFAGTALASSADISLTIHAQDTHGSSPHAGQDAILAAAAFLTTLQQAVTWVLGADRAISDLRPVMATENFAFLLEKASGAYLFMGQEGPYCHRPEFIFDSSIIPLGAAIFAGLVSSWPPTAKQAT